MTPYPLLLRPLLFEKVWGGRRLERFGKALPPGARIGESWELADMASTAPGGGGGAPARSPIDNGPLGGRTLHDALDLWGRDLLGDVPATASGDFPLLVKLLDAAENLSVQVHPSAAYARANRGAHLKTECWVVLDAAPGSVIYKGFRSGVTRDAVERALRSGRGEGFVGMLEAVPARSGDCHTLPSGTVHALGAGVLVAEVQTPSDTTFRMHDWGRAGRELHVEQALRCMEVGPAPGAVSVRAGRLAGTEFFDVERLAAGGQVLSGRCAVLMVLEGAVRLQAGGGAGVLANMGATAVIPAAAATTVVGTPAATLLAAFPRAGA